MARTRKPIIIKRPFQRLAAGSYLIKCPLCDSHIPIGAKEYYGDGLRVDARGYVSEEVVCMGLVQLPTQEEATYCPWSGHVRLTKEVEYLERM